MKIIESAENLNEKFLIAEGIEHLKEPEAVLLMPTDAMYCLACKHNDDKAKTKISLLKKRYKTKSFQLYALDVDMLISNGYRPSNLARKLAEALCPSQLTIVDKDEDGNALAFKISNHPFMQIFIDALNEPLLISSAGQDAFSIDDALKNLVGQPDYALNFGKLAMSVKASTVVEIAEGKYKILREGVVPAAKVKEVLG